MFSLKVSAILIAFASIALYAQEQPLPDSTVLEPIKRPQAVYPIQAGQNGIQGQVVVAMHVSDTGDVESVDVVSGDPVLAKAAVEAARKWKFKPFIRHGKAIRVTTNMPFDFYFSNKVINRETSVDGSAKASSKTVVNAAPPDATTGSAPDSSSNAPKRIRVGQAVTEGLLIHQVAPVYPREAKHNHIQGHVILAAVIGKDGRIANLRVVAGPPELVPAAVGAVQQWRYKPYLLGGEPVEVETTIDINYELR